MPTYDYECEVCDHKFEAFHAMSAEPLTDCPKCHRSKLIKLISPGAAVIIKGTKNHCRSGRRSKTKKNTLSKPKQHDRLGEGKNKREKPFWRNGPVNKDVLKNPEQYIREGKIS